MFGKYFLSLLLVALHFSAPALQAIAPDCDASLAAGWRRDELKGETVSAKDLNIWQVGYEGTFFLPVGWAEPWFGNSWWIDQFYMRSSAFWGWGQNGNYHQTFNNPFTDTQNQLKAKIKEVQTQDFDVGVGWLFPFCGSFWIGPIAGWSYDRVRYRLHDVFDETMQTSLRRLDDEQMTSMFQGAWVGVDAFYNICNLMFSAGYEFHWTDWRETRKLHSSGSGSSGRHLQARSHSGSHNKSVHDGTGHIFRFNGTWQMPCNWDLGVGCRYRHFQNDHGHEKTRRGFEFNKWNSWEVDLNVGWRY